MAMLKYESRHLPPVPAPLTTTPLTVTKCLEKHWAWAPEDLILIPVPPRSWGKSLRFLNWENMKGLDQITKNPSVLRFLSYETTLILSYTGVTQGMSCTCLGFDGLISQHE